MLPLLRLADKAVTVAMPVRTLATRLAMAFGGALDSGQRPKTRMKPWREIVWLSRWRKKHSTCRHGNGLLLSLVGYELVTLLSSKAAGILLVMPLLGASRLVELWDLMEVHGRHLRKCQRCNGFVLKSATASCSWRCLLAERKAKEEKQEKEMSRQEAQLIKNRMELAILRGHRQN